MALHDGFFAAVCFIATFQVPSPNPGKPTSIEEQASLVKKSKWRPGQFASVRDMVELEGPLFLLRVPRIRTELQINDSDFAKINNANNKYSNIMKNLNKSLPQEDDNNIEKMNYNRSIYQAILERKTSIVKVIGQNKFRRLCEIDLQLQGPLALFSAEIQDILKLEDAQKEDLNVLKLIYRNEMLSFDQTISRITSRTLIGVDKLNSKNEKTTKIQKELDKFSDQLDEIFKQKQLIRNRVNKEVFDILTKSQKIMFNKYKGTKIDNIDEFLEPGGGSWRDAHTSASANKP